MSEGTTIKLRIPRQDLSNFTHFPLSLAGVQRWVGSLPVANTRRSVAHLLNIITDLNRNSLPADKRFQILEALCPNLLIALSGLSRTYLNQPLVLPDEARHQAGLSDRLCGAFQKGYTLVAVHAIHHRKEFSHTNPARLTCEALHRAIQFTNRRLLQACQLYQNVEPNTWLTLHQLYTLAEHQQLTGFPVRGPDGRESSLKECYLQALLLGCCKANQLRQSDLTAIFFALHDWSKKVGLLTDNHQKHSLFIVDLQGDLPPMYLAADRPTTASSRYINTRALVETLEELRAEDHTMGRRGIHLETDLHLPSNLIDHLITSLGSHSQRNFSRACNTETILEVAVGLSNTHYQLAGQRSFHELFPSTTAGHMSSGNSGFEQREKPKDIWGQVIAGDTRDTDTRSRSHPAGEMPAIQVDEDSMARLRSNDEQQMLDLQKEAARFPVFRCKAINSSPGGYCLQWSNNSLPGHLHSGDIICLRELNQQNWIIAAIRWVSSLEDAQTLIGVELLSPTASACAARVITSQQAPSEPVRVLLLPEIKLVGKPQTLITPRTGFRERQKIILCCAQQEHVVQLLHQISATAGYNQFDFRYLHGIDQASATSSENITSPHSAFDSLWSKI